jgi:hypothetical protein
LFHGYPDKLRSVHHHRPSVLTGEKMKYLRLIIIFIALLAITGPASVSAAGPLTGSIPDSQAAAAPLYYGDANEDGDIDMGDVVFVERIILNLDELTTGSDADLNGLTNMGDVTAIEMIILGLKPRVPIEGTDVNIRTVTLKDSDLPAPPIQGMTFHFISPLSGEPGPGKLKASYGILSWSIWFGVTDGQLWVYHLPRRESLPESLMGFYDYLGIDQYTRYTEQDGKYWFTSLPPWLNISQYDPGVTTIPALVSASSADGQAAIRYILTP